MIVLCNEKNFSTVQKHWTRTFKVVAKRIPLDTIVEEESIQTKIVRTTDLIDKNLDQVIAKLQALQVEEHE